MNAHLIAADNFNTNQFHNLFCSTKTTSTNNTNNYTSNKLVYSEFLELIKYKSYVPIIGCLLEHLVKTKELSNLEKLFYLLVDSLAIINLKNKGQRYAALPADQWAEKLGCSKAQVFVMQQKLEEKGYLIIIKYKNDCGQNKRNLLKPILPTTILPTLANSKDRAGDHLPYDPAIESARDYLDRTKLFIPLNYQLMTMLLSNQQLSSIQKLIWLDLYSSCYKNSLVTKEQLKFSFTTSYLELMHHYDYNKKVLCENINQLAEKDFIAKQRYFIKSETDFGARQDKSLWQIAVTMPAAYILELKNLKDRYSITIGSTITNQHSNLSYQTKITEHNVTNYTNFTPSTPQQDQHYQPLIITKSDPHITYTDPHITYSSLYINKSYTIKNNEIRLDRSNESNFFEKIFAKDFSIEPYTQNSPLMLEGVQNLIPSADSLTPLNSTNTKITDKSWFNQTTNLQETKSSRRNNSLYKPTEKRLRIKEFHPLSEEDADKLAIESGRDFSLNYINQLMLKLDTNRPDNGFCQKETLLLYLTKALKGEMRVETKVNNPTFRFKQDEKERYLQLVEERTTAYDPTAQLNQKIAGIFTRDTAYDMLTKLQFRGVDVGQDSFTIVKKVPIDFEPSQIKRLLNEIKVVYGSHIERINFVEFNIASSKAAMNNSVNSTKEARPPIDENSLWGRVRKDLINHFGKEGDGMDISWFSKLEAIEDSTNETLTLKAPTRFIKDYVQSNYLHIIEKYCQFEGYDLLELLFLNQEE